MVREMCREALLECGYAVDTANNGDEAWDSLCRNHYDLLITDHCMPLLDGVSLMVRIRSVPSQLPIILTSGAGASIAGLPLDVIDPRFFLAKPFSRSAFLEMVHDSLFGMMGRQPCSARESWAGI